MDMICTKCGESKPWTRDFFYWNKKAENKLLKRCIECRKGPIRSVKTSDLCIEENCNKKISLQASMFITL